MSHDDKPFDLDAFIDRAFASYGGADEVVHGIALRKALSSSLYTANCGLCDDVQWEGIEQRDWYVRLAFSHALQAWQLHLAAAVASREAGTYRLAVPAGWRDHLILGLREGLLRAPWWLAWPTRLIAGRLPLPRTELIVVRFHECFLSFKPAPRDFGERFIRTAVSREPKPEEEPRP